MEPGQVKTKISPIQEIQISLECVSVKAETKIENLTAEEKRLRLKDLYRKMATLESFINQTKQQIQSIDHRGQRMDQA